MEIIGGILLALLGLLMIMVLRLVTTFFHEMGHAIPALLFTDKKVEVYVGSYGDISKTLQLKFGRLWMYLKVNIFNWQIGLCRREGDVNHKWQRAIIIIGGPIASLLIAIPIILKLKELESNELLFFLALIFICAAIFDLVVNLYPFSRPMQMHDGGIAFSDGTQLKYMITESFLPEEHRTFQKLYNEKKYDELISEAEKFIEKDPKKRFPYEFVIQALLQQKEYRKIIEVYSYQQKHIQFDDEDHFIIGKTYRQLDKYDDALFHLKKFHYKNFNNPSLILEMAECYISIGDYEEAIKSLDAILYDQPNLYPALICKANAQIKIKDLNGAELSLNKAKIINAKDPKMYFYFGSLYKARGNTQLAIKNFEKAKELKWEQAGLDFIIEQLKSE